MTHRYNSIHMAIWNGCHIMLDSMNFDWFYMLSFFTELELTTFWSYHRSLNKPPGHKNNKVYFASSDRNYNINLTLNFFSNIYRYIYKIHEVTFPYLSELPPNMNECRSNSLWWLLSRSKHDYGLLNMPTDWDHLKTL